MLLKSFAFFLLCIHMIPTPLSALEPTPFRIYAPSRVGGDLLFLQVTPLESTSPVAKLELTRSFDLGFAGRTITQHPEKPILYVSGAPAEQGGKNLSVIYLDPETGDYRRSVDDVIERDYSYLSLDRSGQFLLGCNYKEGIIDVYRLDEMGFPKEVVASLDENRTAAHCVLTSPDNRHIYIPYVKENNALYQYSFNPRTGSITALTPKNANPPEGTGPRHMAYHPILPLIYFSEEQGLGVSIYQRTVDGTLTFLDRVRVVGDDAPKEGVSASDIVMTPNGKFIYTGIRGHRHDFDFISGFGVKADGMLDPIGLTKTKKVPWGLALSPDGYFLVVTAYKGAEIILYQIREDGSLTEAAKLSVDERISDVETR